MPRRKCSQCGRMKEHFPANWRGRLCSDCANAYNRTRYQPGSRKELDRQRLAEKRNTSIMTSGGRCVCCGEDELLFLRVIRRRVWCFNCNQAKRRGGTCPHARAWQRLENIFQSLLRSPHINTLPDALEGLAAAGSDKARAEKLLAQNKVSWERAAPWSQTRNAWFD